MEQALSRIANEPVSLVAAGRTDRGVHATGQVAGFATQTRREPEIWLRGLNGLTPPGIAVPWVQVVSADFHARYSAVARTYTYLYFDGGNAQPWLAERVWQTKALDENAMHRAAQLLLGEHDFSSLRAAGCQSLTPVRRIDTLVVRRQGACVMFSVQANAFLLHMVRNIASLLHDVGRYTRTVDSVSELLQRRDRTLLGVTAPASGLYFAGVSYPDMNFPVAHAPQIVMASPFLG